MPVVNKISQPEPLRYAHPFFNPVPVDQRPQIDSIGHRMSDFIHAKLGPIPKPSRSPVMELADIIGAPAVQQIEAAGSICFQASGDTGRPSGDSSSQEQVAEAMAEDYVVGLDAKNPAFFLHLGDVIYGKGKDNLYRDEFYRPYMKYPGKIIAIPGNHDGETFPQTDPKPLKAFQDNFCAPKAVVPPIAGEVRIFRQTMTQPGVYWILHAPFMDLVGLYSNIAEGPGDLKGDNNDSQQLDWLVKTLATLKKTRGGGKRRALVIATHHPSYSEGGHSGSPVMLGQIDDACRSAGVMPDAMLAGHSHTYQRYTRTITMNNETAEVAFLVAGCGGHADSSVKEATGQHVHDAVFEKSLKGFGYLLLSASPQRLQIDMIETTNSRKHRFDRATVDLTTRRIA